jgi:hypothetical protein
VDSTGHQKGGNVLRIPVTRQRLGATGKAKQITVQVSFDDGATWSQPQTLTPKVRPGRHQVRTADQFNQTQSAGYRPCLLGTR